MKRLAGIIDTIRVIEKHNIAYTYDRNKNEYIISDGDFGKVRAQALNKAYVDRLLVKNANPIHGERFTLA